MANPAPSSSRNLLREPRLVWTGSDDEEGCLVFSGGRLIAILVRLTKAVHEDNVGEWFLEIGFGPCASMASRIFADLDQAESWLAQRIDASTAASHC